MIPDQRPPVETANESVAEAVEKLKTSQLGARQDLKVSRHLFRGEPSYIVHDPISFQSHRFSQSDYHVLSALNKEKTLEETYSQLLAEQKIADDETGFYEFVLGLQMRGLLDLPILDSRRLFQRYQQRQKSQNKASLMKMVFIKIPLFNPNGFLDKTVHFARPLFSKPFFILWMIMMALAVGLLCMRWEEFCSPFSDILATRNIVLLVIVMTALKFWHELGHAYACKINDGAVPDMGAFLMAGMPMAYVDVSSSWSFASKKQRILVGLGGMYFESIAAAVAMFIWAFTGAGLVHSVAHFVVLMASFMTVLFNANPLMRYDGYYVLSDLTGIPNLRARSTQYCSGVAKWFGLGLPMNIAGKSVREMTWMLTYGVAAVIYQVWLMVTISFMIASQFFLVGMAIGAMFLIGTIVTPIKNMLSYLWFSPEVAQVRVRALALSGILIAGIVATLTVIPVPGGVIATGQLSYERVQVARLPFDSYVKELCVEPNQKVSANDVLLVTENPEITDRIAFLSASKKVADQIVMASASREAGEQKLSLYQQQQASNELNRVDKDRQKQTIRAEKDGVVINVLSTNQIGTFRPAGLEFARVGQGERIVRVLLDDRKMTEARPKFGDKVTVRLKTSTSHCQAARVTRIEPGGKNLVQMEGLTQSAGGDILSDDDGKTQDIYFLVDLAFDESTATEIPENTTAYVRFGRRYETIGSYSLRHLRIFINKLVAQ